MIFTDIAAVVYLDADTIVVKNIDRLNSGVMVVEPSEEHFNDMVSKVPEPTVNHTDFKEASRTI
ncbi:putative glucuronosyltransferase [Helianthus anomalus]